jgi:cell wall assembly regulator SMI1
VDWKSHIEDCYQVCRDRRPIFSPGASPAELAALEKSLGITLPPVLRALLGATNGVMEQEDIHDNGVFSNVRWIVWPCEMCVQRNLDKRELQNDHGIGSDYVFFTGSGSESDYAVPLNRDSSAELEVVEWYPINDDLLPIAPSVAELFVLFGKGMA